MDDQECKYICTLVYPNHTHTANSRQTPIRNEIQTRELLHAWVVLLGQKNKPKHAKQEGGPGRDGHLD